MSRVKIYKVLALPQTLEPNAMYMVKTNDNFSIHMSDANGVGTLAVSSPPADFDDWVTVSETEPTFPSTTFWRKPSNGDLFYQTVVGGNPAWVSLTNQDGTLSVDITGNAATASTLKTTRKINGTDFDGSTDITTSKWGAARLITVGGATKSVDGSAAVTFSLAEIGALDADGTAVAASALANTSYINGTAYNGTGSITTDRWGAARRISIGDAVSIFDGSTNLGFSLDVIGAMPNNVTNYYAGAFNSTVGKWHRIASFNGTNIPAFTRFILASHSVHTQFLVEFSKGAGGDNCRVSIKRLGTYQYFNRHPTVWRLVTEGTNKPSHLDVYFPSSGWMTEWRVFVLENFGYNNDPLNKAFFPFTINNPWPTNMAYDLTMGTESGWIYREALIIPGKARCYDESLNAVTITLPLLGPAPNGV